MGRQIQISVRALLTGGLCVLLVALAVYGYLDFKRDVLEGFKLVDAYLGACQEAGVLPTPQQLNERLAAMKPAPAQEPEGKK